MPPSPSASDRTIAALAAAKARGQALGNPRLDAARAIANANHSAGADAFADSVGPAIREAQAAGAGDASADRRRAERSRHWDGARRKVGSDDRGERASADRVMPASSGR